MRVGALWFFAEAIWLAVAFLGAGMSLKSSPLILAGGILAVAVMLGVMFFQIFTIFETNKQVNLLANMERARSKVNEWLMDFVGNTSDAHVQEKVEDMFAFLTKYLNTRIEAPNYKVVILDEQGWTAFYRNWLCSLTSPSDKIELDSGAEIPVEHILSRNYFGTCIHAARYRRFHFPFDFLILLNADRIQRNAKVMARTNKFDLNVVCSVLLDQALMHEAVHMFERSLGQRVMTRCIQGNSENPFVLEVYNAFREKNV